MVSYFNVTLFGNCQECCKNPESPNNGHPKLILHSAKGHNVQLYLYISHTVTSFVILDLDLSIINRQESVYFLFF